MVQRREKMSAKIRKKRGTEVLNKSICHAYMDEIIKKDHFTYCLLREEPKVSEKFQSQSRLVFSLGLP
jgi:hypothetical protein